MMPHERIYVAIDTSDLSRAERLARLLAGTVGGLKLGKEFFMAHGPDGVRRLSASGQPIFLDLKFHDIPNTVAGAVRAVTPLGPRILNVHAAGGRDMMRRAKEAAREAAARAGVPVPWVIGVSVLTNLDDGDLDDIGLIGPVSERAVRLSELARDAGLDGVVCSAREARAIRAACGPGFRLITPGIRPVWSAPHDQKRIVTPARAIAAAADVLVIGRAITDTADPRAAAGRIVDELATAA